MKFTQEIKDKWIAGMKSGKFIQGQGSLVVNPDCARNRSGKTEHCCLAVLGEVIDFLSNDDSSKPSPYYFLDRTIGMEKCDEIIIKNDSTPSDKQDYSNVIPLIESLEV